MSGKVFTGGCQCGAVRFRAVNPRNSEICHCRMCQKAFGNLFAALVEVDAPDWTRGKPDLFRSSSVSQRAFCSKCGTPLGIIDDDGRMELSTGAFDAPDELAPEIQVNWRGRLAYFDGLPNVPVHQNYDAEDAWNNKLANYQHPDHDTLVWPLPKAEHPHE